MVYIFIVLYVVALNALGMYMIYSDKRKAGQKKWRTRERTFFLLALLGGSIGILLGSKKYRHKTKHVSFKYGIPLIIILQLITVSFVVYSFQDVLFEAQAMVCIES